MNVHFYDFSKRENSTKRPEGNGAVYECKLKTASGILNPTIVLQIGDVTLPDYNYCYIDEYRRYYYITEWTNAGARWYAALTCDILATWRTAIGSTSLYILRSAAAYDGDIFDTYYPVTCDYTTTIAEVTSPWLHQETEIDLSNGTFILGIVAKPIGQGGYNRGSIIYYAMNSSGLTTLITALLDDDLLSDFSTDDATLELQKAIVSPLDYIKSCIWIPITYAQGTFGTALNNMNVWNWNISAPNIPLNQDSPYLRYVFNFPITKHPQAGSRGAYLNCEPYTRMKLYFPPFGVIDLDTTKLVDSTSVRCFTLLDFATGAGILTVYSQNDNELLQRINAQIGVQVQLSQVYRDYINAGVGAVGSVVGAIGSALAGSIGGVITSALSGINSATAAMKPHVSTIGSAGSVIDLRDTPSLYMQHFKPAAEDRANAGRPLCQMRTPASLGGYMLVREGDVSISGMRGEQAFIKETLEGGFYYE